jgi:hypothetical protein
LVVCDLDRFDIRTNFTRKATGLYAFNLAGLAEPANLEVLRKVFFDPDALSPDVTWEKITEEAADRQTVAGRRLHDPERRGYPAGSFHGGRMGRSGTWTSIPVRWGSSFAGC